MTPRTVVLEDQRGDDRCLRVTWHPEVGQFVVSHWRDGVCVATVRLAAADAASLVGVLQDGTRAADPGPAGRDGTRGSDGPDGPILPAEPR